MNNEQAGERVFENIDEALADRIISRSMENSREPERGGVNRIDKPRRPASSIFKIAIPAVLILIALLALVKKTKKCLN